MTSQQIVPDVVQPLPVPLERPTLGAIARRVGMSLLVACAVPAALFYVVLTTLGVWPAIGAALVWSYGAIGWRAATGRRPSGLLILTAVLITGRTVVSMLAGSTFLYFLQPVFSDGVVATGFLVSLVTARPMVARLAGDFYPLDHELAMRPRVRRLFWWLTLMWACLCAGKALMTWWMLESLSLNSFVLVKSVSVLSLNALATTVTITAAVMVARREGVFNVPAVLPCAALTL